MTPGRVQSAWHRHFLVTPDDVRSSAVIVSATSVVCRYPENTYLTLQKRLADWPGLPELMSLVLGMAYLRWCAATWPQSQGQEAQGTGWWQTLKPSRLAGLCWVMVASGIAANPVPVAAGARRHRALHRLVADDEALPIGRPLRGYGYISICCQSCACGSHHDHGLMRRKGAAGIAVTVVPTHLQNAPRCCEVFWAPCS